MNYKKTWFGWLNFTVGTLFSSVFIFTLLVSLFEFNGLTVSFFDFAWARASFFASLGVLLVIIGLLFFIHLIKKKIILDDNFFDKKIFEFIYAFAIVALLAVGIFLRYQSIKEIDEAALINSTYYYKINAFFNGNTNGVTDVFVMAFCYFYSFLLKVFGLNVFVIIVTNIVFQILGALCIAGSLRFSYGKTVSISAFSLLMVLGNSIASSMSVSPDAFIFFWVSLIIALFSALLRDREQGLMRSNSNICLFIMFGIIFGFLSFVNPIYFIIPVYFTCRIMLLELNDAQEDILVNRRFLPVAVTLSVTVVSTFLGLFLDAIGYGISFGAEINDYINKVGYSEIIRIFYPDGLIVVCLIILIPILCGYINFIFSKKDNISALAFTVAILYAIYSRNIIAFDTSLYLIVFFGALMGVGVKSLLFEGYGDPVSAESIISESGNIEQEAENQPDFVETEVIEPETEVQDEEVVSVETEALAKETESAETESHAEQDESVELETQVEETVSTEAEEHVEESVCTEIVVPDTEYANDENEINEVDAEGVDGEENVIEDIPFVPIENILPVPKAHIKKTMGFPVEPGEKYMKFDYEISDNDDFDIE